MTSNKYHIIYKEEIYYEVPQEDKHFKSRDISSLYGWKEYERHTIISLNPLCLDDDYVNGELNKGLDCTKKIRTYISISKLS